MFSGRNDDLSELGSSRDPLLAYPESELNAENDEEPILYAASFDELAKNHVKYDTVIWVSISLLLVLAWGIGIVMLLCIPIRRYMLQKDISSRKLYVTANEIVYKFSRPSMLFWRATTIEKCIPLSLVIDIIIEQGCLQSVYGIHTFRVESIVHGKAAPVDELQVQGVADPGVLRKVIITEASKNVQDFGKGWKPTSIIEEESLSRVGSLSDGRAVFKSPPKSWKMTGSPRYASMEHRGSPRYAAMEHRGSPRYTTMEHTGLIQGEMLLNKLGEVCESVKKMESLIEKSQTSTESS
ncbi:PROTEIN putative-RELATED [Salix koriyanagi]|uniref:PROTEIN putative-RELATED n=1 Tax=Salix koriyanagi TaxID=2511006 RepID=A0A9Q0YTK5_9ROSI|nr:PROTEIN putative-RELATED [Salix koriyanagi]